MILTSALYRFASLPEPAALQGPLRRLCEQHGVRGTLLLAPEGINGTIAGTEAALDAVLAWLRTQPGLAGLSDKRAAAHSMPFHRLKVRIKREIVTLGVPGVDPTRMAGTYVKPADWNALISQPDVVVVDVRNDYEVRLGSFAAAVNPHTQSFSELPQWVQAQQAPGGVLHGKPKVAMFCTGGIRCEKSTALLRMQGFEEVFHLDGGILKYLETTPQSESLWQGECFVFDERVSVGHQVAPGSNRLCRACRMPLTPEDCASPHFRLGVSCPHCHDRTTDAQKLAYAQRQRQVELAEARQTGHIGVRQPGAA